MNGPADLGHFRTINDLARRTPWLHGPATAYASYGIVLFALLLLAGFLLARSSRNPLTVARSVLGPVAVLVAVGLNQPIVHRVNEQRPWQRLPDALVLVHRSADGSFPSDHATMAGAVAVALLLVHRRLGLLALGAALVMAFARVYVGAHFPVDVLAGLILGGLVAAVVVLALAPLIARLLEPLLHTALRPLLLAPAPPAPSTAQQA